MKSSKNKITIYELATLCSTSSSTVSAVMNGTWRTRRIGEATADRIRKVAADCGYMPNLQASGLRRARSGMAGLLIPTHDNRFFTSLSKSFEAEARVRGLVPLMASSLRNPIEEQRITRSLITYAIEFLFVVGARDPEPISELCNAADVPHIFLDLPGKSAPSVISDNYGGAIDLMTALLAEGPDVNGENLRQRAYFIGGDLAHDATFKRVAAFGDILTSAGQPCEAEQIITCGYGAKSGYAAMRALTEKIGGVPTLIFINSQTILQGVLEHFLELPDTAFSSSSIGCWDYHPLATALKFPMHMVRQNSEGLIANAFGLIDQNDIEPQTIQVKTELLRPRQMLSNALGDQG